VTPLEQHIISAARRDAVRDATNGEPCAIDAYLKRDEMDRSCWSLYRDTYDAKIASLGKSEQNLDYLRSIGAL
jgi:hypothetical protein